MTDRPDKTDPRDAKALRAFGDHLAEGRPQSANNDIEASLLRTQRALGADRIAASAMPDSIKHTIWEDLMNAQNQTLTGSLTHPAHRDFGMANQREDTRLAAAASPTSHRLGPSGAHDSRIARAVAHWQPAVSLAVVVAFLIGLIGVAYQRGVLDEPNPPGPSGAASQVMYDDNDASTYPEVPAQCATNGPVESDAYYLNMAIGDLPQPEYTPVQAVTPDVGKRIQDTYLRLARCEYESTESYPYPEATPTTYSDVLSPLALSYFSDRARITMLYPTLDATQRAELDAAQCRAVDQIMAGFPLPVNQPIDYALISSTVDNYPNVVWAAFQPSDVYLLPDGRFGAVMGSVSTAALIEPASATQEDSLSFIAFIEEGGRYLIDEEIVVFAGAAEPTANPYFPATCW